MFNDNLQSSLLEISDDRDITNNTTETLEEYEYNPDQIPPDFHLAQLHAKAKMIYKYPSDFQPSGLCPCCGLPIKGGEQYPISEEILNIYNLGCGYALYFDFLKLAIYTLCIMFVLSGIPNIITSAMQGDCSAENPDGINYCYPDFSTIYSIADKRNNKKYLNLQMYINLITVIALMVFFQYIRLRMRKLALLMDDDSTTPSDYTVQIKGLSVDPEKYPYSDRDIKEFVESHADEYNNVKVVKVCRAYMIANYVEALKEKNELHMEIVGSWQKEESEKMKLQEDYQQVLKNLQTIRTKGFKCTDCAFVSLERANMTEYLNQQYHQRKRDPFIQKVLEHKNLRKGKFMIRRSAEPTDIVWENIGFPPMDKLKRRLMTSFYCFFLIFVALIFEILISYGQIWLIDEYGEESTGVNLLNYFSSLLVVLVDPILGFVIGELTKREKHSTKTGYYARVASKMAMSQFMNGALTLLFAKMYVATYHSETLNVKKKVGFIYGLNFYGQGGLMFSQMLCIIANAFSNPFMVIFDPAYILKLFLRKKELKAGSESSLTQEVAHQLFQGPDFDPDWRYGYLLETMLLVSFYAPAIPLGLVYTIIGLFLTYWADRYIFFRRIVLPPSLGFFLQDQMMKVFRWVLVAFSVGNIVFASTLLNNDTKTAYTNSNAFVYWLTVLLGLSEILLPMNRINRYLFPLPAKSAEEHSYDEAREKFFTDYDLENPITRVRTIGQYIKMPTSSTEVNKNPQQSLASPMLMYYLANTEDDDDVHLEKNLDQYSRNKSRTSLEGARILFNQKTQRVSNDRMSRLMMSILPKRKSNEKKEERSSPNSKAKELFMKIKKKITSGKKDKPPRKSTPMSYELQDMSYKKIDIENENQQNN